jgi:hypothetical protein
MTPASFNWELTSGFNQTEPSRNLPFRLKRLRSGTIERISGIVTRSSGLLQASSE